MRFCHCALIAVAVLSFHHWQSTVAAQCPAFQVDEAVPTLIEAGDRFGNSAAIEGDTVVVAAKEGDGVFDDSGAVYVFDRSSGSLIEEARLTPTTDDPHIKFGRSLDLDNGVLAVGSPFHNLGFELGQGAVFIFEKIGGQWQQTAELTAPDSALNLGRFFGNSLASQGDTLIVGAPSDDERADNAGAVYVFEKIDGQWQFVTKLFSDSTASEQDFGWQVALDGDTLAVGAPFRNIVGNDSGAVYVFRKQDGQWPSASLRLRPFDAYEDQGFGRVIALSGDDLVVSDWPAFPAAVYYFQRYSNQWYQLTKLEPWEDANIGWYGISLAIENDTIAIGASFDDYGAIDTGSVYVFKRIHSAWRYVARLVSSTAAAYDELGTSVAMDSGMLISGAAYRNEFGGKAGAAYLFDVSNVGLAGDMNDDGRVNLMDVDGFVEALLGLSGDESLNARADMDCTNNIDSRDIQALLDRLLNV